MIPENNHTIPQAVSWNSKGEGSFMDWNSEGMRGVGRGVAQFGIPDTSSEFPEKEDGKSLAKNR